MRTAIDLEREQWGNCVKPKPIDGRGKEEEEEEMKVGKLSCVMFIPILKSILLKIQPTSIPTFLAKLVHSVNCLD